ncbi:MAG: hypothetical protein HC908_07345, partial [Calothrix sp. SM1_7_51]|nr:hypothetical protein [Calothrix sp. SM1_7_51]
EHPETVKTDQKTTFALLTTTLESLPTQKEQHVEIFLRIAGTRFPYAKHLLILKSALEGSREWGVGESVAVDGFPGISKLVHPKGNREHEHSQTSGYYPSSSALSPSSSLLSSSLSLLPSEEKTFDPFADVPDLSAANESKSERKFTPVFLAVALLVATTFGGGGYFLSRPCVMLECKEILVAQELQRTMPESLNNVRSEQDLIQLQQQLDSSISSLQSVPPWSLQHQDASNLLSKFTEHKEQVGKVLQAFQIGNSALEKSFSQGNDSRGLEVKQQLWRQAIAPLETIPQNSQLYGLVQQQLSLYKLRLQNVNQLLSAEDRWLKKLTGAKAVANEAAKRETAAQSLQDWQKAQSTWQVVINALTPIPQNSSAYPEAQKLLAEYQPKLAQVRERITKEILAARTYNQAVETAAKAKRYEELLQWSAAANHWQQALSIAKSVTSDNPYFTQAQALIESYSTSFNQIQGRLQTPTTSINQTRADLEKPVLEQ